jgi:hypothetical protein
MPSHKSLNDLLKLRAEKRKHEIGFESQERAKEEHTRTQEKHEMAKERHKNLLAPDSCLPCPKFIHGTRKKSFTP